MTGNVHQPKRLRVAIYGRVSTEHEAQLSAFENQQTWYENVACAHPEWDIVERYYDEGITGTAAQKRPAFMRMLADANSGRFDMIVTREVCRFARNTVDTLTVTRELSKIGVEVYFIQDNIHTMDGDGELRLTLMATLAQEESRKISERVRAGQQVSREKGTLYGNGNILGYERVNGTYVINPEQAYVVHKIFELYASGLGYKRICGEIIRLGCKNAHGEVAWTADRIGRILCNATYKGMIGYNKSHSDGYLTQKRVNHTQDQYVYVKGDFEPIVSEELWNRCEELRKKKSSIRKGADGTLRKAGRTAPDSVWTKKLRCSCGSSFRRFLWHKNADGRKSYGYECYRQKRQASAQYLKTHGKDASQICQTKSIPYWHVDLLACKVFRAVWQERKEAVLLACQMLEECAAEDQHDCTAVLDGLRQKVERLRKMQEGLRSMCALGDITREDFLRDHGKAQQEIEALERQIEDLNTDKPSKQADILDMDRIRSTLDQWIDLSGPIIPDELIDQFILQVVVVDDNTYNVTLDFSDDISEEERNLTQAEIARRKYFEGRGEAVQLIGEGLSRHITEPKELFSFEITAEDAREYCKVIGMKFFGKKWKDKKVIISI